MATKKHKTVKKIKHDSPDAVILAYERYQEFTLMDALAGEFHPELDTEAAAAFAVSDAKALLALGDRIECPIDFVEPYEALAPRVARMSPLLHKKGGKTIKTKRTVDNLSPGERIEILADVDGTRVYARVLLEKAGGGTPFDV